MDRSARDSVRLTDQSLGHLLKKLDDGKVSEVARNARRSQRYQFRMRAIVEFVTGKESSVEAVPCRNLSRDGISFLTGRFVYPGTLCRIRLVSEFNQSNIVEAKVIRCRYISGTAGVHEVGAVFSDPVDIGLYHRGANSVRALLVTDDRTSSGLIAGQLTRHGAETTIADSPEAGISAALSGAFELVVLDHDSPTLNSCEVIEQLRARGYVRPLASLSINPSDAAAPKCPSATKDVEPQGGEKGECRQCGACMRVSLMGPSLGKLIESLHCEPVISSLASSPETASLINSFVFSLQERVAAIERACAAKKMDDVRALITRLGAFAGACGFEPIVDAAEALVAEVNEAEGLSSTGREKLTLLVQRCLAARPLTLIDETVAIPPRRSP
ncbi:MAG: PilZ domain-containing protein [Planctomycetes bacterium]|nr:PilZ domain-containing protein [Planctomycetota bacterium]